MPRRKPFKKCVIKEMEKGRSKREAKDICKKRLKKNDPRQT